MLTLIQVLSQARMGKSIHFFAAMKKKYPLPWQQALIFKKISPSFVNDHQIEESVFCEGQDLKLPDVSAFPPIVQSIFYLLFTDLAVHINKKDALRFLLVNADPLVLKSLRQLVQYLLDHFFPQLQNKKMTFANVLLLQHLLAYYPFFGFSDGDCLLIPQQINQTWKMIQYQAKRLHLTPSWMGSPVTACALAPLDPIASPILIFKGTSYPTDEGFALSVLTDINPFASVGSYAFHLGKENIFNWLKNQSRHVTLIGLSLGGALALHAVAKYAGLIDKVYAFNPPALHQKDLVDWKPSPSLQPEVNVLYHENDLVPTIGFKWGDGWNIYRIYLEERVPFLEAHIRCFIAEEKHLILKIDSKKDEIKRSRLFLAYLHVIFSFFLFPISLMIYIFKKMAAFLLTKFVKTFFL